MSVPIDQSFVEYVVKSLVEHPDAVSIERTIDDRGVLLLLTVDPEDLGRVIGKRGSTAQSIRTLLRALGSKSEERLNLKIVDNGPERPSPVGEVSQSRSSAAADGHDESQHSEEGHDEHVAEQQEEESNVEHAEHIEEVEQVEAVTDATDEMIARHKQDLADLDDLDI